VVKWDHQLNFKLAMEFKSLVVDCIPRTIPRQRLAKGDRLVCGRTQGTEERRRTGGPCNSSRGSSGTFHFFGGFIAVAPTIVAVGSACIFIWVFFS